MAAGEENADSVSSPRALRKLRALFSHNQPNAMHMPDLNVFARTDFRGEHRPVGIRREDRRLHMYVIGRTGMGKTSMLLNMALNDINGGEGVCFIDPHGDAVESLLDCIPASRIDDVIYINPADTDYPIPMNVLERTRPEQEHLLVSGVIAVFRKVYGANWQNRQEHILRNTLLALLEREEQPTLWDVYRLLIDWRFRKRIVEGVQDPVVSAFWKYEFHKYQFRSDALTPLLNKLGLFLTSPVVRGIVARQESRINFRSAMDERKVLLVNLSKGKLGEDNASFLGSLIILKLQLAAMSRIDQPEAERRDHYLYVDEFQSFVAADGLDHILSEARKFRLSLILAHQYLGQIEQQLRLAILGNVGTVILFTVGPEDSEAMAVHFGPAFRREDLTGHRKYHVYVRLAIDGRTSEPFSAETLEPPGGSHPGKHGKEIRSRSRQKYGLPRSSGITDPYPRAASGK